MWLLYNLDVSLIWILIMFRLAVVEDLGTVLQLKVGVVSFTVVVGKQRDYCIMRII